MKLEDFYLRDLFRLLWNGKWVIGLTTALMLAYSANQVFRVAVPMYDASARVVFSSQGGDLTEIGSILSGFYIDEAVINTEVEIIRSRGVIEKLVAALDLTSDPEFNVALRPPEPPGLLPSRDDLKDWIRGWLPEAPAAPTATAEGTGGPVVEPLSEEERRLNETVAAVTRSISVTPRREAFVFDVTAVTTSADKSALIANTLARIYFEDQVAAKFESVEYAVAWMTNRVDELRRELDDRQEDLRAFRSAAEVTDPRQIEGLQARRIDLSGRLADLEATAARLSAQAEALTGLIADPTEPEIRALADPALTRLIGAGLDDETRPAVVSRLEALRAEARASLARHAEQREAVRESLAQVEPQLTEGAAELDQLAQLEFAAGTTQQLYETLLLQQKEVAARLGSQQADGRVLSRAIPGVQVSPLRGMTLLVSGLFGLLLGVGLVLLWGQFRSGVKAVSELEALGDVPVIGQVPLIPLRGRRRFIDYVVGQPLSVFVESIRNLRTSLLLARTDRRPQVIVVSSSIPGEGKTSVSIALAGNLAGVSERVLLVEGDIRRNSLSQYFPSAGEAGLVEVIGGVLPFEEAVIHDDRLNIDVILSGSTRVIAADFFSGPGFAEFVAAARDHYDTIVIDTPPVLLVPDARIIARHGDATVYCVQWSRAVAAQVAQGLREFAAVGVEVTGLALTQIDFRKMQRYGYEGYGRYGYGDRSSKAYYG